LDWNVFPSSLENKNGLSYYSKFFKFVEVNSTLYSIPSRFVFKIWKDKTPDDFKFALKFPKLMKHDKKMHKGAEMCQKICQFFLTI
jgi:uncharacterized protein YecE (DUF72 family)